MDIKDYSSMDYSVSLSLNAAGAKDACTLITSSFLLLTITPRISPPMIPPDTLLLLVELLIEPEIMARDSSSSDYSVSLSLKTFGVTF